MRTKTAYESQRTKWNEIAIATMATIYGFRFRENCYLFQTIHHFSDAYILTLELGLSDGS